MDKYHQFPTGNASYIHIIFGVYSQNECLNNLHIGIRSCLGTEVVQAFSLSPPPWHGGTMLEG